jgi:class 3 adenylate cyclase
MPACGHCGQDNPPIARFCLACGKPLADAPPASHEERRLVSVIFVDLVGFTARAERLDPEDVQALLRPYHDAVRADVESFGGSVEKFIGDAVVGVFGAPTAYGDDAERAVRSALAVRDTVARLNEADASLELSVRIAVNTGEALVTLDARTALGESMVAGDVINTASRLQSAAPVDGILVGEETYRATRDAIEYVAAPAVVAKGKELPVPAWCAVAATADERAHIGSLVGRTRELDVLRGIWQRVADEREPHLVTVIGPAGVGKSRLGLEFAVLAEDLGARAVRGRSLPYRDSSAYGALGFQLKQLCRIFESDSMDVGLAKLRERVGALVDASAAPSVAEHLAIVLGLDRDRSAADRESLFFSIRVFIEAIAREQPTMLVFEDLHWADDSLLDLVELLAGRLREIPLLMLALVRPDLLDARPGWGGGLSAYSALPLRPLGAADASELASQRLSTFGADDAQRAGKLAELAGGNPFFIEQLAAAVRETDEGDPLPTSIRGIVAARLDALPPPERLVLLNASVAGKTFWRGVLERMSDGGDGLGEALIALERRDLIRRETVSAIEGDEQYSFTHVLVRDSAYELLPRARRQERHRVTAQFLEDVTAEVGEAGAATARHWRAAGDTERASEYYVAAAEAAERGWAKQRAAELYQEALKLVPETDVERRTMLRRRLALAHQASMHVMDAQLMGRGPSGGAS